MIKFKSNKKLSVLISASFLFSTFFPMSAYALEAPETPSTPDVSNQNTLDKHATESDKHVQGTVDDGDAKSWIEGDNNSSSSDNNNSNETLNDLNAAFQKQQLDKQQVNQTSKEAYESYTVQDKNGNTVVVTRNPCYQKTEARCSQPITLSETDSNGKTQYKQHILSTLKYLSNDNTITPFMEQQIEQQARMTEATNNALDGKTDASDNSIHPLVQAMQTMQELRDQGVSKNDAMIMAMMSYMAQQQQNESIKKIQEYKKNVDAIQKAKDNVSADKGEDAQLKNGTFKGDYKNKRFTVRITPAIPQINSTSDIKLRLVTPSGKPNDPEKYQIMVSFKNMKTGRIENFEVRENLDFIVEKAAWTKTPGTRTIQVVYSFKNKAEPEKYEFSYYIGQLATAILPDGRTVNNSVVTLVGNADVLNYNVSDQAVAGRVKDAQWSNGKCYVQLTDAKDDNNGDNWPSATISTTKIPQHLCTMDKLKNKYISFGRVSAKYNGDSSTVFTDQSNSDEFNIMEESAYDNFEDNVAEMVQDQGNTWDNKVLKVSKDGTIYEGLPGQQGIDFLNLVVGNGENKNIAIHHNDDGTLSFAKADGTPYSSEELASKGIDIDAYTLGLDENGIAYAVDKKTGKLVSQAFSDRNTSSLSRIVVSGRNSNLSDLNTDQTLTNKQWAVTGYGINDENTTSKVVGSVISTLQSGIINTMKSVVSIAGNTATIGGGLYASASLAASNSNTSGLQNRLAAEAQKQALLACKAVPDRCSEFLASAKD